MAATSARPTRIAALDFTKGALVIFMVLYHWLNYFVSPEGQYYRYLRFLTPSFIFITGFFVSQLYLRKYAPDDPRPLKRLFTRAMKLMVLFIVLNVSRAFVVPALGGGHIVKNPLSLQNMLAIFVSGNLSVADGKLVSFFILVPISYVLMLSGILIVPHRFYRYTFHVMCGLLLLSSLILRLIGSGSQYLELVTIGMLGVVIGFIPMPEIDRFVRHPYVLTLAYVLYTISITIWNVPFGLEIVGVCLTVMALYLIGTIDFQPSRIRQEVLLLGKYSLFGYISQIAILQILGAGLRHFNLGASRLVISAIAAFALTVISVELVDRGRAYRSIDKAYRAVFS